MVHCGRSLTTHALEMGSIHPHMTNVDDWLSIIGPLRLVLTGAHDSGFLPTIDQPASLSLTICAPSNRWC
jgi:hypothetical protein